MSLTIKIAIDSVLTRILSPRARPFFKIKPEVINDTKFQSDLADSMDAWKVVKKRGLGVLEWWEIVVKPGIRKLAIHRSKEINKERRGELYLLLLR